jgi:hippurate hydrolase
MTGEFMNQEQLKQQLIAWRHHLHAHPESAFEEVKTSAFIAEKLEKMGIEVHRNMGKTGLVGVLKCGEGKGVIAIRADIDCHSTYRAGRTTYRSTRLNGCMAAAMTDIPALRWARRSCCSAAEF